MAEINQNVENSCVENMAGRDINITHIHQNKFHQNKSVLSRNKKVARILKCRGYSAHFEYIINTHAEKCYGSCYFMAMSDKELQEMYKFVCQLQKIFTESRRPSLINWLLSFFRR